jgi:FkbM family methyltransferase
VLKLLVRYIPESLTMHLHAADHYLNGEPELRILKHVCRSSRTSVDIGANIGIYTYFLRRYTPKVHAYEPNRELALRLRRLFPDVNVRNAACSDHNGILTLRMPVQKGRVQHELASVSQNFEEESEIVSSEVLAVTIDSEELSDVGFIKIDVEQHEIQVLRGSVQTIRKWRPNIMTEVTPLLYERGLVTTFQFLTEEDYEGWFVFNKGYYPFSQFSPEVHAKPGTWGKSSMGGNVFFFPKECDVGRILRL